MKSIARKLTAVVLVAAIAIVSVFAFARVRYAQGDRECISRPRSCPT